MSRPHAFSCYTPPFVPVTKNRRSFVTRKTPQIGSLKPAPKNGLPGTSSSRQSRPLSTGIEVSPRPHVLSEEQGRIKPCSVNAASWFPLPKPWPIYPARSRRAPRNHARGTEPLHPSRSGGPVGDGQRSGIGEGLHGADGWRSARCSVPTPASRLCESREFSTGKGHPLPSSKEQVVGATSLCIKPIGQKPKETDAKRALRNGQTPADAPKGCALLGSLAGARRG